MLEDQFASLSEFAEKNVANEGGGGAVNAVCFQNICP